MQSFLEELFYTPKHSKITDKVMAKKLISSLCVIVLCLIAISFSAYSFFSSGVSTGNISIKSASFTTDVSVVIKNTENGEIDVITSDNKHHVAVLDANTEYEIVLKRNENCTAKTGFVSITLDDSLEPQYHTQQLGKDGNNFTEKITFYITLDKQTKFSFTANWGTSTLYNSIEAGDEDRYIKDGDSIVVNAVAEQQNSQTTIMSNDEKTDASYSKNQSVTSSENSDKTVASKPESTSSSIVSETSSEASISSNTSSKVGTGSVSTSTDTSTQETTSTQSEKASAN